MSQQLESYLVRFLKRTIVRQMTFGRQKVLCEVLRARPFDRKQPPRIQEVNSLEDPS